MQERTDKRKTKRLLCALLAAAAVMGAAMPCAAVRIEPMPEQAGTLYGTQGIEREIYQPLSQAVQQGKTELDLSLSQPIKSQTRFLELCRQALTQVRRDYPESFLDNHTDFTYYYNQNGYYRVVYQLGYLKLSDQQKQSMTDEVEKIVRQGKKQCSNIVQLLQYFQETLCRRVEYDMTAAKSDSDHYPTSFHAYGALMKGKSVCQGYAYAFKLLCDQAQIPCWIVTGYYGDEPHAWNYVWLDGAYYLVDVTWDDANGRASDSPWFLAGSSYAKNYRIEDNSAPGELAASSYFTAGTKQQAQRTDQQESRPARSLSRAANS